MRKPNAIFHMIRYGFVYGFLFAMIYIWGAFLIFGGGGDIPGIGEVIQIILGTSALSLIFGSIPGTIIGFVEGWILWMLTRGMMPPLPKHDLNNARALVIAVIGALTVFGAGGVLTMILGTLSMFFLGIPILIAGGASAFAANRYVLKLQAWGINNIEKSKNKEKHIPKNKLGYENETDSIDYSDFESDAQEMER